MTESTDFTELTNKEPWLSSTRLVVKPDMLFGKRGKSGLVALNLDLAQVAEFVKARLGVEVYTAHKLSFDKFGSMGNYFCSIFVTLRLPSRLRWVAARHRLQHSLSNPLFPITKSITFQ